MPTAPPRACPKCRQAFTGHRCPHCYPAWRNTHRGGNTRKWRTMRRAQLDDTPLCQAPGCTHLATEVDHIVPLAEGGARYDWSNLQSLCSPCHTAKTQRDAARGRARRGGTR